MNAPKPIAFCPFCGSKIAESPTDGAVSPSKPTSLKCDDCDQSFDANPEAWQAAKHQKRFEYKSKMTIFEWPVVHIVYGVDPATKKPKIAKGLIAIGPVAIGGVAIGGTAVGGLAFGGAAIGMVSFGGAAIGLLFALGGMAIGSGLSIGGGAVGTMAIGGGAFGYYAIGGGAHGVIAFGANNQDPFALAFFQGWRGIVAFIVGKFSSVIAAVIIAPILLFPFLRRNDEAATLSQFERNQLEFNPAKQNSDDQTKPKPSLFGLMILMLVGSIFGIAVVWLILACISILA